MRGKSFIEFEGTRKQEGQAPPTCYSDLLSSLKSIFYSFCKEHFALFHFFLFYSEFWTLYFCVSFYLFLFFRRIHIEGEGKRNRHHFIVSSIFDFSVCISFRFLVIFLSFYSFICLFFLLWLVFNQLIFMSFIC